MDLNVHFPPLRKQRDEFGNNLFRVLIRPIDIVAARDDGGKVEGLVVCSDEHFCCGFCRGIWICRCEDTVFGQIGLKDAKISTRREWERPLSRPY